ncbi:MAG: YicC/YloC family endoribonuclease [Planctomycetota bacterium]
MTGFGQADFADDELSADVIVRTVNGRHLKTRVRLGLQMPGVSERISALVREFIQRGTVDVFVRIDWSGAGGVAFNERIIHSYVEELEQLRKELGLESEIRVDQVAQLPGAVEAEGVSDQVAGHVWQKLKPVVTEALQKTVAMRASEGRALAAALRESCEAIRAVLPALEERRADSVEEFRARLKERVGSALEKSGLELDEGAVAREVIHYSERSDIAEEICRMKAHADHFQAALGEEASGRKLDFIAQEMHREANTMSSKVGDPEMSERVIDLRDQVDHIREQVANLE